ncbi:MAG: 2Fe-2S iron-sulfur cluster-binding protein [Pseudomonadota bacterium]
MSRFHLRQRLRSRVQGLMRPKRDEHPAITLVLVLPDGSEHRVEAEPGYTLVMASQILETPIHAHCPDGHCGLCQVDVLAGAEALRPPSEAEVKILEEQLGPDRDTNVRLACHAKVERSGARIGVRQVWSLEQAMGGER